MNIFKSEKLNKEIEVIDKIEKGYEIWNIGEHIESGYLPIAKFKNYHMVDGTLKVIKNEKAQLLLKVSCYGYGTINKCKKYLKENPKGKYVAMIEEALEELKRISV